MMVQTTTTTIIRECTRRGGAMCCHRTSDLSATWQLSQVIPGHRSFCRIYQLDNKTITNLQLLGNLLRTHHNLRDQVIFSPPKTSSPPGKSALQGRCLAPPTPPSLARLLQLPCTPFMVIMHMCMQVRSRLMHPTITTPPLSPTCCSMPLR